MPLLPKIEKPERIPLPVLKSAGPIKRLAEFRKNQIIKALTAVQRRRAAEGRDPLPDPELLSIGLNSEKVARLSAKCSKIRH